MTRFILGGLVLACACLSAMAGSSSSSPERASASPSMHFKWHSDGSIDDCGATCRMWISAVGPITDRTPGDFDAFVSGKDVRGATLVLDSEGGSVVNTIALGHTLRRLDITTTVGKTLAPDGRGRATLSPAADCESMCAFILLGGARRYVPPQARVLVHQIWLSGKRDRATTASYTADELVLVEHDIGALARYTVEMGGSIELLETALKVPPWEPLYKLSGDEIQRMGLNTIDHLFQMSDGRVAAGQ